MESVTLIESGTNRRHFALLKQVELAKNAKEADEIVLSTIGEVKSALSSKDSRSLSSVSVDVNVYVEKIKTSANVLLQSSLAAYILVLLQCLELFPSSLDIRPSQPSIQFALIASLQLAATAKSSKEILLAYTILGKILQAQHDEERQQTSLLILNTVRQHLESGSTNSGDRASAVRMKGKNRNESRKATPADPLSLPKISFALKSVISGVISGPDIFPALYGPVSLLCHHSKDGIQSLALDALGKLETYVDHDEGIARAIWERSRGILSSYEGKGQKERGASQVLARALLRAIRRAVNCKIIGVKVACDAAMRIVQSHASPDLSITSLESCIAMIAEHGGGDEELERIKKTAAEVCLKNTDSYATLQAVARILGKLAHIAPSSNSGEVQAVWTLIKTHLHAKNANRKLLAIDALQSFLPYSWPTLGNEAGIQLEELEMASLLNMLGDRNESARLKSLQLFKQVDGNLLEAHYDQLVAASKNESLQSVERKELAHRAIEVAGERFARGGDEKASDLPQKYIDAVNDVLSHPLDEAVDNAVIRLVLCHLRRAHRTFSNEAFLNLLQRQADKTQNISSTCVLLCASLACELDCDSKHCKVALARVASILPYADSQAAPMEALLIGSIKLAFSVKEETSGIIATTKKIKESNHSSLVQHRLRQLLQVLTEPHKIDSFPSGTLLHTMDRVESYFEKTKSSPSVEVSASTLSNRSAKPLKYEAYQDSNISSQTMSTSGLKQPFSALPAPSLAKDERIRRRQKLREDGIQEEMQKSIARLTLGEEDKADEEDDKSVEEGKPVKDIEKDDVLF